MLALPDQITSALSNIPEYTDFLTLEELQANSENLIRQYSDTVRREYIGRSEEGRPLEMLVVGDIRPLEEFKPPYRRTALGVGVPHPEEVCGALAVDYTAEYFARNPAALQELGIDTYLGIKVADVDGFLLNKAGLKDPSPRKSVESFYRPPYYNQFELSFPITGHPELSYDRPTKAAQAVAEVIDVWQPIVMASFHNSKVERGGYYMANRHIQAFGAMALELSRYCDMPLMEGLAEQVYATNYSPGVYSHASVYADYAYRKARGEAMSNAHGALSFDYLMQRVPQASHILTEMPAFAWRPNPNEADRPSGITASLAMIRASRQLRADARFLDKMLERLPFADNTSDSPPSPRLATVQFHAKEFDRYGKSRIDKLVQDSRADTRIITQADAFERQHVQPLLALKGYMSILAGLADEAERPKEAALLRQRIDRGFAAMEAGGELRLRPIRNSVGMQVGGMLGAMALQSGE